MNPSVPPPLPSRRPPPLPMSQNLGIYCEGCREVAPTRHVVFIRHIGAVVVGINQTTDGRFCRSCVNQHFATNTLITSTLGWWGVKSFFFTPFYLGNNLIHYARCGSLKSGPAQRESGAFLAWTALGVSVFVLLALLLAIYAIFFAR